MGHYSFAVSMGIEKSICVATIDLEDVLCNVSKSRDQSHTSYRTHALQPASRSRESVLFCSSDGA